MKTQSKEWAESKLPNEDGLEIGAGCSASDLFGHWRSIDTAPKDGTHILAHDGNEYYPPTVVHWFQSAWYLSVCPVDVDNEYHPTYWLMGVDWPNKHISN